MLKRIFLFGAIGLSVFVAIVIGASSLAMQDVRVGGPTYHQIIEGKDLVADVLPPPLFVIEADLTAILAARDPANLAAARQKIADLHKQYDERQAHWASSLLPESLKAELAGPMGSTAAQFWRTTEQDLMPALASGDKLKADQALARVQQAFEQHRAAVDKVVVEATKEQTSVEGAAVDSSRLDMIAMVIGGLTVVACLVTAAVFMAARVFSPMARMTAVMERLASGDVNAEIEGVGRKDEIGAMARALVVFRDNAIGLKDADVARAQREVSDRKAAADQSEVVAETGKGLSALAAGDLTFRITREFPGEYAVLKSDFNQAMEKLNEVMGVITANANAMQTGAGEISQAADDLSRRTEQQAATLEETAAALDQITATVRRTAEGAERANVVVTEARSDAEASGQVVTRAVSAMGEIEKSAGQISQIIGVIDEIAFQTNLLALNAGVEAARAGDAGRGFAVVAQEVRALAQRSAVAAKEIKALISASTGQVKDGVALVGQTGVALTSIVTRVSEINTLIAEINASAQEQATALGQVNTAVNQMDQTTQQNAAMVEQSTAASHNLNHEAGELTRLVGRFQLGGGVTQSVAPAPAPRAQASNPVRAAQSRIAEFANRHIAPKRAVAGGASVADDWEEF